MIVLLSVMIPGYAPLITEYVFYLLAKLRFHRQHPEFNGKAMVSGFAGPY